MAERLTALDIKTDEQLSPSAVLADDSPVLRMARRGWRLFPANREKKPLIEAWPQQASNDPAQLRFWAKRWSGCNWALATGAGSGIFVLDVDGEPGLAAIRGLSAQHGWEWIETLGVKTGRGSHHYFAWPEGANIRNSAGKLGPGLDIRGEGGYVIVPPSIHPDGHEYHWLGEGENVPIAQPPHWLLEKLVEPVNAVAPSPAADGEAILEGGRNAALTSLAGSMRRRGMTPQAIEVALLTENAARCKPPLPEGEVCEIATSVARYEPTRLREQESPSRTDAFCSSLANGEAERTVLGCELSDSGSLYRVLPLLKAEDFFQDSHRRIHHAIAELAEAGKPVDELTVTDALLAKGQLASVGGVAYLSSLASNLNTGLASANIEH